MTQEQLTPQYPGEEPLSFFDRPLLTAVRLNWEMVAWAVLILVATVLRFVDLGARAMSHDESLHSLYSYYLYDAGKYEHNPMMHGPLLFHANAFFYFLFGDNDTTARIFPALCGIGIVWMAYFYRRYLGRLGAFFAGIMLTVSPSLLFHSRYIRDDIYIAFFLVVWVYAAFRYLDTVNRKWLFVMALGMILGILAMEAHFISGAILGVFFGALALWQVLGQRALPAFIPLIISGGIWYVVHEYQKDYHKQAEAAADAAQKATLQGTSDYYSLLGVIVLAAAVVVALVMLWRAMSKTEWIQLRRNTSADLAILMATLVLPFTAPFIHRLLHWDPMAYANNSDLLRSFFLVGLMTVLSVGLAWFWFDNRPATEDTNDTPAAEKQPPLDLLTWGQLMGLFWVIAILFYTTFLTNIRNGLATGIVGSLGYWLAQQNVERGSQPWYYYIMLGWMYEFLPLLLTLVGAGVVVRWLWRQPDWDPVPATDLDAALLTSTRSDAPTIATAEHLRRNRLYFALFGIWWVIGSWIGFTVAGEKMPWLLTHMALPMCIFGGWYLGRLVHRVDWEAAREHHAVWLVGVTPALILLIGVLVWGSPNEQAAAGFSTILQTVFVLAVLAGLAYMAWNIGRGVDWRTDLRLVALGGVILLFLFTIRFSYMLTYINYDMATEYLVYAHASPDIKRALAEIDLISQRTVGGRNIEVAYDDESSWPLSWYMRQYPKNKFYGSNPNSDNMTVPVIIVGPKNYEKVRPYVQRDYIERTYRLVWWPDMGYFDLSWEHLWKAITDPVQRERNWDIFFYRRFRDVDPNTGKLGSERDLAQWPHRHEFKMWVRKDIAAQIWDLGVAPAAAASTGPEAIALTNELDLSATALYNATYGDKPLLTPRAIAAGPDGLRVIADSGNHRIVVLDANGNFVRAFGSMCKLNENLAGCIDPDEGGPLAQGDGQFNEPWGVAVDPSGQIYVADTWNGRVQVFDPEGKFLRKWGVFNTTNGDLGDAYLLFGPRGLAIDQQGNLLLTDTGNKRIIRYSPDGTLLQQIGGGGVIGGRFEEPVGLAVGPDGSVYVADAWNQRVQKLSPTLEFISEMAVPSWDDKGIYTKPYLAVAGNGDVYVTDPQFYRVFVYDAAGQMKANFGNFGGEMNRFGLPNGIAYDAVTNSILVADAGNNRVMVFATVP